MSNLWKRKSLAQLVAGGEEQGHELKKTLGAANLIALGIGAIIGAGLFVRTAVAAADHAGPAVTLGFVLAAIGCAFAGLCYAEFASMIPIAGSAYTYSYATLGELIAWIIGWDLVLEYAIGAATVGIAWSEYLNKLLEFLPGHYQIPYAWCHSPFQHMGASHGIMNIPALFIVLMLSLLLIRGMKESAFVNGIIVITKVAIVILIITLGWHFIDPANHTPYIPPSQTITDPSGVAQHYGGFLGIIGAAGVVFFAFIGFDAVSTAAQETVNPKRDMPIGILGSLVVCTVLYILFAHVLTGIAPVQDFRTGGREASVAYAIMKHMPGYAWLAKLVTVAILFGFTSVILVMLMGQSRVFYSMSRDGLVPRLFSDVHPKYRTPWKSNVAFFLFVGAFAAFVPEDIVGDMTSIGTLFAFVLVCIGVWVMRVRDPDAPRQFKVPMVPVISTLGVLANTLMIFGLGWTNWLRLGVWLVIGLVIYFLYGRHHSKLATAR
ncbi:MAG TPA: amino acid permease [Polyangia bacterium]|nr:amino acid permease [Polyangia bacterium]